MTIGVINFLVNVSPLFAAVFAQLAPAAENQALYSYGPLGVMCAWFMWRGEALIKEVRSYGHKLDGLRLALLASAAASDSAGPNLRKMCEEEITRINAKGEK